MILVLFLIIIWALRLIIKKRRPQFLCRTNRFLRRHHKLIGLTLIITGLLHGLLSSERLFSPNLGTATWIVSVLLGMNWLLRKKLSMKNNWMAWHRILTAAFVALIVIHIIDVGGFILDDLIAGRIGAQPALQPTPQPTLQVANTEDITEDTDITGDISESSRRHRRGSDNATTTEDTQEFSQSQTQPSEDPDSEALYADGVYQGTGTGYRPGLVVEVVIKDGMIASVTVISHNEKDEMFWGAPVELIPEAIVESQSTDVDSISGATRTSEGIKEAVEDALSQAII